MSYVDGFVLAVPKSKKEEYIAYAKSFVPIFKQYGALKTVENWGDSVPDGEVTSFPMAVRCQQDEVVCFSWITWPSKDARETAWAKMMDDPRFDPKENPMPFDGKRMIYGGFETIVDE